MSTDTRRQIISGRSAFELALLVSAIGIVVAAIYREQADAVQFAQIACAVAFLLLALYMRLTKPAPEGCAL